MAAATAQKILGAFYTADPVARFLVRWTVREPSDVVLDPSCGDGVFLEAAVRHILNLGGNSPQVWGVDVDSEAVRACHRRRIQANVFERDFFSVSPGRIPPVTAIVGNPPFVRYQAFTGMQRTKALRCASAAGVNLPQLCSSWAPFIVHASTFLRTGGRLGMVAPAELVHAKYAREVLDFLQRRFGRISVRMFQKRMFSGLSEDTVLLLCEDFGKKCSWFSIAAETSIDHAQIDERHAIAVDIEAVRTGRHRLTRYLLSPRARHLYDCLAAESGVERLGDAAKVSIGYVTGCNDYFHVSTDEAKMWRVPRRYLLPAVLSLSEFKGTVLTRADWKRLSADGRKSQLLRVPAGNLQDLPQGLRDYLIYGEKRRVNARFKCRIREPWYRVPHVRVGDAFLSYMSGSSPKLVRNAAALVAPNTLHVVNFLAGWTCGPFVTGWQSSLTRLSCEVEGHALGGGLLKLEPFEAANILIALPLSKDVSRLAKGLESALREDDPDAATDLADTAVLRGRFGLSASECAVLRDASNQLGTWRMHR
jgi:adenine-specific DNA-methyltransferase